MAQMDRCASCNLPRAAMSHDENEIGRVSWAHDYVEPVR